MLDIPIALYVPHSIACLDLFIVKTFRIVVGLMSPNN